MTIIQLMHSMALCVLKLIASCDHIVGCCVVTVCWSKDRLQALLIEQ